MGPPGRMNPTTNALYADALTTELDLAPSFGVNRFLIIGWVWVELCVLRVVLPERNNSTVARQLMVRWAFVGKLRHFSFQPETHKWCNKGRDK